MALEYTVESLPEVADYFQQRASDQRAIISRRMGTAKDRAERAVEARVWEEAAEIVRGCRIEPAKV